MAPYYNQGKEFRFENELDDVFIPFTQALDLFDNARSNRLRLVKLRATPEFQKAFAELGSPEVWEGYEPTTTGKIRLINPRETDNLYKQLHSAVGTGDRKTWRKHRRQFVDNVLGEYRTVTDWICMTTHQQSISTLVSILRTSGDRRERQSALGKLVEHDAWFLTVPEASEIIRQAEIAGDETYRAVLSRALNPKRQTKALEKQREIYALRALSCFGYEGKSFSQWAEFFKYYNRQLGDRSGRASWSGFPTLECKDNVRRRVRDHNVPKTRSKGGRPKAP